MQKILITLACCASIAPLALGESPTHKKQTTAMTEQAITVTGTVVTSTTGEGTATNYQPAKTLIVRQDRSNGAERFVLNGPGHIFNRKGEVVRTGVKPGTHVRVYYASAGNVRTIDHVIID
jgi:tRNA splicing endonuclease